MSGGKQTDVHEWLAGITQHPSQLARWEPPEWDVSFLHLIITNAAAIVESERRQRALLLLLLLLRATRCLPARPDIGPRCELPFDESNRLLRYGDSLSQEPNIISNCHWLYRLKRLDVWFSLWHISIKFKNQFSNDCKMKNPLDVEKAKSFEIQSFHVCKVQSTFFGIIPNQKQ